jgi:hypothetical protein
MSPRDAEAWRIVHDFANSAFPRAGAAFSDMHVALAQAVAGNDAALEVRERQMEELERQGRYPSGPCVPAVSRAFANFERRDFSAAIDALEPIAGSAFSMGLVLTEGAFRLWGAEPRSVQRATDSGRTTTRWVCSECGTWVCSGAKPGSAMPDTVPVVRAGTLDDTSWLRPTTHYWTRSKQPWITLPEGDRISETQPTDGGW